MNEETPRVALMQTEDRRLHSQQVGREYQLAVWLPPSYASSSQHYPVIYVLDGDVYFPMAITLLMGVMYSDGYPESILVGIGYNRSLTEWVYLRERDFKIPAVQPDTPDGHAERFLAALKQEIIPFIDAAYRTDPRKRTLYGFSSSGFFALYTLANEPDLFQHYLAGSPDTDQSCPYLLAHDQKLATRDGQSPIDLFLTVGGLENGAAGSSLAKFDELSTAIQMRRYPGLRLMTQVYVGEGHSPVGNAMTLIQGLRQCRSTVKA